MLSELDKSVATYACDNDAPAARTAAMLAKFIADRPTHTRFMNAIDAGTYAQPQDHGDAIRPGIDQPTLKHLAEETRHAFFFKRHPNREAGPQLGNDAHELVAPLAAPAISSEWRLRWYAGSVKPGVSGLNFGNFRSFVAAEDRSFC